MWKYIYSENTLDIEIKQKSEILICDFYISWLKVCRGFSIFDSVSFFIKVYIFVQPKGWSLWPLKFLSKLI